MSFFFIKKELRFFILIRVRVFFLNGSFSNKFENLPFHFLHCKPFWVTSSACHLPCPSTKRALLHPVVWAGARIPLELPGCWGIFFLPAHDYDFFFLFSRYFSFGRRKMFACLSRCTSQITPQRCFRMFESLCRHFGKAGLCSGGPIYSSHPSCASCTLTRHRIKLILGANLAWGRHLSLERSSKQMQDVPCCESVRGGRTAGLPQVMSDTATHYQTHTLPQITW